MKIRASRISDSILIAVSSEEPDPTHQKISRSKRLLKLIFAFFSLFKLLLTRYRRPEFRSLRKDVWRLDEREYLASFQQNDSNESTGEEEREQQQSEPSDHGKGKGKGRQTARLEPMGDLGYSGSTFFTTPNGKYLIKSLPRRFEYKFFTEDLLDPYVHHMRANPRSLLVRITDVVHAPHPTLGGLLGIAPTHHIIMENLLYGRDAEGGRFSNKWETYDLKPNDYFFPERDIADGRLAPESVKDKLVDEFHDRVRVSAADKRELVRLLEADTRLLADRDAIDYSLFLVRYPGPRAATDDGADGAVPQNVPFIESDASAWRTGLVDADGKWTYRVVVLDFFWARHTFRAWALTGLVKSFNKVAHKGPMSITANPTDYRKRFLKMIDDIVIDV
ncbi:SAICAR synthase-like protein [Sodiomyces alkalinus F11]|uniref:SAICAR synthase-like protein n=1 Tax=Sodiomyces alkalinus (strain CBS 110278 / VKM F-3762 / F11) TaxID=1314773 RepID=A0A3N2PRQ1_SODAK|nr:SAICAR synthase-like protein [Sodiomyces alkalinus F11]ROT37177.1 SAICAR synthase-like protein [Sodiomyces alkalinus F11]